MGGRVRCLAAGPPIRWPRGLPAPNAYPGGTAALQVVNHRTDVLPWYAARGYAEVGTEPFACKEFDVATVTRPSHFVVLEKPLEPLRPARTKRPDR